MKSKNYKTVSAKMNFYKFDPHFASKLRLHMLDSITYKVWVETSDIDPSEVQLEVWTNEYDQSNSDGVWHAVAIPYMGEESPGVYLFAITMFITSDQPYQFTYRMRHPTVAPAWVYSNTAELNGKVDVLAAREFDSWTQGPNLDHIIDSIYCGNFLAAENAKKLQFTHVLNVARNLDMEYDENDGIVYRKVGMTGMHDGAHNVIPGEYLQESVAWLKDNNVPGNKILVHCKKGVGRAGSTAIAYMFATNPSWSFEQAKQYVLDRRWVYPHKNLERTLYSLFPRDGMASAST